MRRWPFVAGMGLLLLPVVALTAQGLTKQQADSMAVKVQAIYVRGELPPGAGTAPAPLRTSFSQQEANAYFHHYGPQFLPAGLVDPRVAIADASRVQARAVVDLDRVRTAKHRGWLDPLAYVTGSVEVTLAGRLFAANGVGVIRFESATVGGVDVSESVVQELISFYTVTPENPRGFRLGEPFDLPSNIRAVQMAAGAATVVQ